jgi:hypothetical protein
MAIVVVMFVVVGAAVFDCCQGMFEELLFVVGGIFED